MITSQLFLSTLVAACLFSTGLAQLGIPDCPDKQKAAAECQVANKDDPLLSSDACSKCQAGLDTKLESSCESINNAICLNPCETECGSTCRQENIDLAACSFQSLVTLLGPTCSIKCASEGAADTQQEAQCGPELGLLLQCQFSAQGSGNPATGVAQEADEEVDEVVCDACKKASAPTSQQDVTTCPGINESICNVQCAEECGLNTCIKEQQVYGACLLGTVIGSIDNGMCNVDCLDEQPKNTGGACSEELNKVQACDDPLAKSEECSDCRGGIPFSYDNCETAAQGFCSAGCEDACGTKCQQVHSDYTVCLSGTAITTFIPGGCEAFDCSTVKAPVKKTSSPVAAPTGGAAAAPTAAATPNSGAQDTAAAKDEDDKETSGVVSSFMITWCVVVGCAMAMLL